MNLSWWWCKHFSVVYLLIIPTFLLVGSLSSSSATESEPTEEPVETNSTTTTSTIPTLTTSATSTATVASETTSTSTTTSKSTEKRAHERKKNSKEKSNLNDDDVDEQARALLRSSSGNVWRSARKMLSKGIRMFRESLLEGAKVAHMLKGDFDEGMSTIMRQNRGVKVDIQQQQTESSSSSFFDSQMLREGIVGGILRFMGINSKQVGVIALNCLIIFAEWITSSMIGGNDAAGVTSRMIKTNLLEWASTGHNNQVEKLISTARSHSLPEKLIDSLSQKTGNSTSCVQLLICKMSPVIWSFQDTVKTQFNYTDHQPNIKTARNPSNNGNATNTGRWQDEPRGFLASSQYLLDKFVDHLPEKKRIMDFGDRCEMKFPHCQLLKFQSKF